MVAEQKNFMKTKTRKMKLTFTSILFFILLNKAFSSTLEEVTDVELAKLINQEQYVVVLFGK